MIEFGKIVGAGEAGYRSARVGLRAPRVAVRIDVTHNWQSWMALAIWTMSDIWGGYGFIIIPHQAGVIAPALRRVLRTYDPDYICDLGYTFGDLEEIEPGWISKRVKGAPEAPEAYAEFVRQVADQEANFSAGSDSGVELCNPYFDHAGHRPFQVLSAKRNGRLHNVSDIVAGTAKATFEVPRGLDSPLMLALGLKAGFTQKPSLNFTPGTNDESDHLPLDFVRYALSHRTALWENSQLDGLTTAWDLTRQGLIGIAKFRPNAGPAAVIGSTADDFALALALDRMYGSTTWIPREWIDSNLSGVVTNAFSDLLIEAHTAVGPPMVTSISIAKAEVTSLLEATWPKPSTFVDLQGRPNSEERERPQQVLADRINLDCPRHLACEPNDYDLIVTTPVRADGKGGFEFVVPVPVYTPRSASLQRMQRPFWEVDVEVEESGMPSGRGLEGIRLLAEVSSFGPPVVRSGRDGISFNPLDMGFVSGGASLAQSVAKPRLHILGLLSWIDHVTRQREPGTRVELSDAGRRASILTRLWGSRSATAQDILALREFLLGFTPTDRSNSVAYPEGDGFRLAGGDGVQTLRAGTRSLAGSLDQAEVRRKMDRLIDIRVLQRGLVIPCSECERAALYRTDQLREQNVCPRCGGLALATAARRKEENGDPEWFYDLHGGVRELLAQHGDVPLLAAAWLASSARTYYDVPEIDLVKADGSRTEIDLIALVDGRLIVGEAKCNATFGTTAKTQRAANKLIAVADNLDADELLVCTSAPGPWKDSELELLKRRIKTFQWRRGDLPTLKVVTDLYNSPEAMEIDLDEPDTPQVPKRQR